MEYFTQSVTVDSSHQDISRLDFLTPIVTDHNVLHVGFVDYPITKPKKNLHLRIAPVCKRIDGIDPNSSDEIKSLLSVPNGDIYDSWNDIPNDYDVIIVPEVIEHVDNVALFLQQLDQVKGKLIITAPCAYKHKLGNNFKEENGVYIETVHPDHNCWYTPYTLKNVINKYSKTRQVTSMHWVVGSIVAICDTHE
jgi:hypothetical protein